VDKTDVSIATEEIAPLTKRLTFSVPWRVVSENLDNEFNKLRRNVQIAGFRKGKAPRDIIEKKFRDRIKEETVTGLINKFFWNELGSQENQLIAVKDLSKEEITNGKDFVFSVIAEFEPSLDPVGYKGMTLEKIISPVKEREIDELLESIRESHATLEDVSDNRPLAMGDFANISFEGLCDGVPHDGMQADNYLLEIGSNSFIQGFEEGLLDMVVNETRELQLQIPEDYPNLELRSKEATFRVTLKGIKKKVLPELTDEFISSQEANSGITSLEGLIASLRENLKHKKRQEAEEKLRNNIAEKLLEINQFDAPSSYVEKQLALFDMDYRRRIIAMGLDEEEANKNSLRSEEFHTIAEKIVKKTLLFKSIAKKEGITVSDVEIDEDIKKMASAMGKDFKTIKKMLENRGEIERIGFNIFNEKVFSLIKGQATITERESEEDGKSGQDTESEGASA